MCKSIIRLLVLGLALSCTACVFAIGGARDWEEWGGCPECDGCLECSTAIAEPGTDAQHRVHQMEARCRELEARLHELEARLHELKAQADTAR